MISSMLYFTVSVVHACTILFFFSYQSTLKKTNNKMIEMIGMPRKANQEKYGPMMEEFDVHVDAVALNSFLVATFIE